MMRRVHGTIKTALAPRIIVASFMLIAVLTVPSSALAGRGGEGAAEGSPSTAMAPLPAEPSYGEAQTWYLAEGYTGGEFDTWVLVQNPGEASAHLRFDFQLPPGSSAPPFEFDLPGGTRQSIHLDNLPGLAATDVSTMVTADRAIMVERAMYFNYNGKTGGHDSIGVKYPSDIWYLAEGYTGDDFDTWVLVQNPGDADAHVTLEFQLPPGSAADPFSFDLPAGTRRSIHLDELPGLAATDVSTKVVANLPVVAERAVYFNYFGKTGGHDSIGVVSPSERWFLAEGYTGDDFDTWVLVQNPGEASAHLRFDFQLPPGSSAPPFEFDLPGGTRQSIHLDNLPGLAATEVSTTVTSSLPVVAERAMYFNYFGKTDGHDSAGVDFPSGSWYMAEGYTGRDFDTWVLVQNPGQEAKHVVMEFQLPPGASAPPYEFDLPGGTRQSIHLDNLPGLSDTDVSTKVTANGLVVAERAEYFNYEGKDGGHCSAGSLYEPPIIPDTTKILQDAELDHLAGAAKSGDGKELVLTFDADVGTLQGIEVGDVIVGGITANTPYGILQKVVGVNRAGGQVILNTVSASLEEAVWRGRLYEPLDLSAADLVSTRILAEGVEFVAGGGAGEGDFQDAAHMELPFTYNFNNVKLGTDPNYLLLNGKVGLTFKADFNVDIDVEWPSLDDLLDDGDVLPEVDLKSVDFGVTVEETVDIRGSASVTKDIAYEKEIVEHEFAPIDVQIGPVPVILVPYIEVYAGVDGTVSAGISFGAVQKGSVYAGAAYDGSSWTPRVDKSFSFEWTPPSGSINADAKVYAGPQFGIKLYGVCGPYLNLEPYVRMVINTATPPLWKVYVGIEVDIGVKAGIELEFEADTYLYGTLEWDWSLELFDVKWDGALRWEMLLANVVKINSLSPSSGPVGTEVTIKGSGFGDTRENDSYVKFGSVAATEYASWSAGEIKCKVPAGVSGTVQVKVTHIFHAWGPVTIQVTSNGNGFTVGGGGGTGPGTWNAQSSGTTNQLNGVDALDTAHVWAVGSSGTVRFFNGSSWGGQSSGTTQPLYDVSAADASHVWAVGYQGTIRYYNGSSWGGQSSGTTSDLFGVYAADASHVWAVGAGGTIRFFNGSSWVGQSSGTTEDLHSVEGLDASHVWAVGNNGTVLFYNGSGWSKLTGTPSNSLGDIWVKDANNIWALGVNLYHYDGSGWTTHVSGWTEGLVSVAGLETDRVWTGRWYGVIHFWNGSDWVVQDVADQSVKIMDIDILDPTHMWAVGSGGTVLFNDGT